MPCTQCRVCLYSYGWRVSLVLLFSHLMHPSPQSRLPMLVRSWREDVPGAARKEVGGIDRERKPAFAPNARNGGTIIVKWSLCLWQWQIGWYSVFASVYSSLSVRSCDVSVLERSHNLPSPSFITHGHLPCRTSSFGINGVWPKPRCQSSPSWVNWICIQTPPPKARKHQKLGSFFHSCLAKGLECAFNTLYIK